MNKIISITKEVLFPNQSAIWVSNTDGFILLEALCPIEIKVGSSYNSLEKGDLLISKKVKIQNPSNTEAADIRGFKFTTSSNIIAPVILKETEQETREWSFFISKFFESFVSMTSTQIYQYYAQDFESLFQKLSYNNNYKKNKRKIDIRLVLINRYIRKNYERPITLQELAEMIQCNPVYLSNTYSKVFNISPMKYLQYIRMKRSKELLLETNMNIGEIANKLCYVSSSQFSFLFKRYYNLTPMEYRRIKKISEDKSTTKYFY